VDAERPAVGIAEAERRLAAGGHDLVDEQGDFVLARLADLVARSGRDDLAPDEQIDRTHKEVPRLDPAEQSPVVALLEQGAAHGGRQLDLGIAAAILDHTRHVLVTLVLEKRRALSEQVRHGTHLLITAAAERGRACRRPR
jgi:hypothetical protein